MTKALNLKDLPSKTKYYNKFDGASGSECNGEIGGYSQWEDTLKGKLNDYRELTTSAKKIGGAYCSACNMNTSKQTDAEPCQFFYHWLGDKYWNDLGNKNLSDLLSAIYQTLKGDNPSNKCRFQYSDVNKDLLPQMKKVFDYYYEHTTIYDGLMKNGLNCKDELYTYLKEVSSACITMRNNCPNTTTYTSGSYCKDFHDTYEVPCGVAEALDSYCTTNSALEVAQKGKAEAEASKEVAQKESAQAQSQLKEALSKASTSSTLSSTFGTLAAMEFPALAYFLFKYKPWSSLFGNHSSGNGRNRRSKRRNRRSTGREVDTLTETSTVDFTASSETSSTFYPNAVPSSAAYTRQPRKGRTNSKRTSDHHQRTNVGYGRM